jgi:hypothetical protein
VEWEEIHGFESPVHFHQFEERIANAVDDGSLVPVPAETPYASLMFEEKWFRSREGQNWRLVAPDFPFKGVFLKVSDHSDPSV